MRLLITTQAVDENAPELGFFTRWIEELAKQCESVLVVCLFEGAHTLPSNVRVYSLGKERGDGGKFSYTSKFLRLIREHRDEYDVVFVHQNQEYVLIAGVPWKLWGKRVYLWRNHYAGSLLTDLAVMLSTRVFCTSRSSYTATFSKTILMPVGVDTRAFSSVPDVERSTRAILSVGRIAPSKNLHILIEALGKLHKDGIEFTAAIYGDAASRDAQYAESLMRLVATRGLEQCVSFHRGTPNRDTPRIYSRFGLFVNASRSGMLDKTIFEAAACGCTVIASSRDFAALAGDAYSFREDNALECAGKIALHLGKEAPAILHDIAERNSLTVLAQKLTAAMS